MSRNVLSNLDLEKLFNDNDHDFDKFVAALDIPWDSEDEYCDSDNEDRDGKLYGRI